MSEDVTHVIAPTGLTPLTLEAETPHDDTRGGEIRMRRLLISLVASAVIASAVLVPTEAAAKAGGLSPAQLNAQGWTCFDVSPLGVHCSPPGKPWPPTEPTAQLLYFFNTTDPTSAVPDFTGTETLIRADVFNDQPCPTEGGSYTFLGGLGLNYWACHRR
jgi:hypothetical protein